MRWRIEVGHRILKTGCRVEFPGHHTGEQIERADTIKAVIAWRLMTLTLLGRDTPALLMEIMFSDIEILTLKDYSAHSKRPVPENLGQVVLMMAILGGYPNRKSDCPSGHQII